MKEYEAHPIAELFPIVPSAEMAAFVKNVRDRGLQTPITLYEGKILDGRHRYEACCLAEAPPTFVDYVGDDPVGFVIAANLRRRHLTPSQLAMIAAKLETFKHGGDRESETFKQDARVHLARKKAAESLGVSPRAVASARKICDSDPELARAVGEGKITVRAAEKKLDQPPEPASPVKVLDETGYPIPPKLHEFWNRRHEIQELMTAVSRVKTRIEKGRAEDDVLFRPINQAAIDQLERTYSFLADAKPHAVCLTCQGLANDACRVCKGTGLVSKFGYETRADKDARAIREKFLAKNRP